MRERRVGSPTAVRIRQALVPPSGLGDLGPHRAIAPPARDLWRHTISAAVACFIPLASCLGCVPGVPGGSWGNPAASPPPTSGGAQSTAFAVPGPRILRPADDAEVDRIITVAGDFVGGSPSGQYLTLMVLPLEPLAPPPPGRDGDGHQQRWWVQEPAMLLGGRWESRPVYVGEAADAGKRYRFRICAVLTESAYRRGEQFERRPDGPASCVDVTRR